MIDKLLKKLQAGDKLALSRILTLVENNTPDGNAALDALFPLTGNAHLIGVTGAPGTGKSTLVNNLALHLRKQEHSPKIAIIAVDPTSPYTGGALLGDRVRMRDLSGDHGIFIRSMASRGALGGLAHTTAALSQVLDAAGYEVILVETVGAGQSEVEIASLAHTVIVVEAPGMGDEIQAIKAGILEIADILVVNKADRPGAENSARALRAMLEMSRGTGYNSPSRKHLFGITPIEAPNVNKTDNTKDWATPVVSTIAIEGKGLDELLQVIVDHLAWLKSSGTWERRERANLSIELESLIRDALAQQWAQDLPADIYQETIEALCRREIAPHTAVKTLLAYNKGLQ